MLKVRIIPTMLWNGTTLVKGNKFENEKRSAGSPLTTIKIYNSRDVDEILFLDISRNNEIIDKDFILSITDCVSVPITIGGGIEKISQMNDLFEYGADKISINSIIFKNPNLINEAAKRFGSQAITVSIDVKKISHKYCINKFVNSITNDDSDMFSLVSSQDDDIYDHIKSCKYCRTKINVKIKVYYLQKLNKKRSRYSKRYDNYHDNYYNNYDNYDNYKHKYRHRSMSKRSPTSFLGYESQDIIVTGVIII